MKINKVLSIPSLPCPPDEIFLVKTGNDVDAYMSNNTGTELHRIFYKDSAIALSGPTVLTDNAGNDVQPQIYTITNFDLFSNYNITADHGQLVFDVPNSATQIEGPSFPMDSDQFHYTPPAVTPVSGYDYININGQQFSIRINKTKFSYSGKLAWASDLGDSLSNYSTTNTGFITPSYNPGNLLYFKLVNDTPSTDYNIEVVYSAGVSSIDYPVTYDQQTGLGSVNIDVLKSNFSSNDRANIDIYLKCTNLNENIGRLKIVLSGKLDSDLYDTGMFIAYSSWQDREFVNISDWPQISNRHLFFRIADDLSNDTYGAGDPYYLLSDSAMLDGEMLAGAYGYNLNNSNSIIGINASIGNGSHITRIPFSNNNSLPSVPYAISHEGFSNIVDANGQLPNGFITLMSDAINDLGLIKIDPSVITSVDETLGFVRIYKQYPNGDFVNDAIYVSVYMDRRNLPNVFMEYNLLPMDRLNSYGLIVFP